MPEALDLLLPLLWAIGAGAIFLLGRERLDSHAAANRRSRDVDALRLRQPFNANDHASHLDATVQ